MSPHRSPVVRVVAVVVATLLSALGLAITSPAQAVSSHRPLNDTRPVGVGVVEVGFPIEYFGLVADLPSPGSRLTERGRAPFGEARFRVQGAWTRWQPLDQDGAQAPGHFTGALVGVDRADAYQVRNLPAGARGWRAAAINTTDGPAVTVGSARSDGAVAASGCRSRADWGADESISGWARGDVQGFSPVQTLTVHHTAGSNDLNQDYAATVRAIYSYHVQTNGWSDIGYQYLVDGHGVVYEGRSSGHTSRSCLYDGGDGSDFAHQTGTDDLVTGAHVANFNSGNAGIALLGCYEPTSACSGSTTPPAAAVNGLDGLLASLSTRHGLDPTGTVHYVNPVSGVAKDVATISGHRDWEATACPGGNLYSQLPAIRSDVASRMAPTPSATVPDAPSSTTATSSGDTVALSWAAPAGDGGAPVTRYEVFRGTTATVSTSSAPIYSGSALSTTDRPAAGSYYYAVRACNAIGCGATATAGPVSVVVAPATITSASCSGATCTFAGKGTPTLRWTFGNGTGASGSPVSVTYGAGGTYTVVLTDGQQTTASRAVQCDILKRRLRCRT